MTDRLIGPGRPTSCALGCDRDVFARGWCRLHYRRWQQHGIPTPADDGPTTAGPVLAWLDPTPMLMLLDAFGGPERIADESDRRAYHRARLDGTVSDIVADRLCCRWLRMPLENVYGLDWGERGRAA